jgi:hypothetical protein
MSDRTGELLVGAAVIVGGICIIASVIFLLLLLP